MYPSITAAAQESEAATVAPPCRVEPGVSVPMYGPVLPPNAVPCVFDEDFFFALAVKVEPSNAPCGQLKVQRKPDSSIALQLAGIAPLETPEPPGQLYDQERLVATVTVQLPGSACLTLPGHRKLETWPAIMVNVQLPGTELVPRYTVDTTVGVAEWLCSVAAPATAGPASASVTAAVTIDAWILTAVSFSLSFFWTPYREEADVHRVIRRVTQPLGSRPRL
jgi:hypothetical protein